MVGDAIYKDRKDLRAELAGVELAGEAAEFNTCLRKYSLTMTTFLFLFFLFSQLLFPLEDHFILISLAHSHLVSLVVCF